MDRHGSLRHRVSMHYSVILPVYNERENVLPLIREILASFPVEPGELEIIAVDDASTDGSWDALVDIAAEYPEVKIFRHRVNCGQSAALLSGIRHASGDIVMTLDADGQNDPADFPALLAALADDTVAVCGIRRQRRDTWARRISSKLANRFRNAVTGDTLEDSGCAMRVMRRSCLHELPAFNGLHRFLPTILRTQGFRVEERLVGHRHRMWGTSKYGIHNRLWRGVADCLAMRWWRKRALPGRRLVND